MTRPPVPAGPAPLAAAPVFHRDPYSPHRVRFPVSPLLATFNDAEVLEAADVHIARQLGRLAGESDPSVLLAVALTVRAVRLGSVCLDLQGVRDSVVVAGDPPAGDHPGAGAAADAALPAVGGPEVLDPELLRLQQLQASLSWPEPQEWLAALAASPLVEVTADEAMPEYRGGPAAPLRLHRGLLYLDRYWRQEREVAGALQTGGLDPQSVWGPEALAQVDARLTASIADHFAAPEESRQRVAAAVAATRRISVVAGGPGTGKTTAVARILAVLAAGSGGGLRIALAAPTGKAAARLGHAVNEEIKEFGPAEAELLGQLKASTLHRLLGSRGPHRSRFKHDATHRLPHDVVVIDETSMVPLTMMARVVEALRPEARLILVGDPDQLASVEAGAVLGDIVGRAEKHSDASVPPEISERARVLAPADVDVLTGIDLAGAAGGVVRLTHRWRFGEQIGALADAIRSGDADAAVDILRAGSRHGGVARDARIEWIDQEANADHGSLSVLRTEVVDSARELTRLALSGDVSQALGAMDSHRLLCAHRNGPFGNAWWARVVQRWIAQDRAQNPVPALASATAQDPSAVPARRAGQDAWWEPGRPLLVTENDYELGLFNGDTGVVVLDPARGPVAVFGDPAAPTVVRPGRLGGVQSVYAMTIHKSQGSQFDRVTVILPPAQSPLLTRELLYTAATRAADRVRLVGTEAAVRAAISRPVSRASGLRG